MEEIKENPPLEEEQRRESKQKFEGHWHFNIPEGLVKSTNFTSSEKWVYCAVCGLAYKRGLCWASNASIALQFGGNVRTVQRAIKKLVEFKYLYKTFIIHNGTRYRILITTGAFLYNNKELIYKTMGKILDDNMSKMLDKKTAIFEYNWLDEENED